MQCLISEIMKIAVVGATGLVGRKMLEVLQQRNVPCDALFPAASEKSAGNEIEFKGERHTLRTVEEVLRLRPDIALFSAGTEVSLQWAGRFADAGIFVIDNSSAWRMNQEVPLVVPEVNAHVLSRDRRLIANPNCSTIQMVMALAPLHRRYGIRRVVVSTYQAVTGSGMRGVKQLDHERKGLPVEKFYPHPIDLNLIPHGGQFLENGYTTEEMKLVNETRKILNDYEIQITATVVRVPVYGGHSESVNVELKNPFELSEIRKLLNEMPGVIVLDDPAQASYPMPLYAENKDEVFVGRIRRDFSVEYGLNLWIVSDNLRKGAATNAVQIAEAIIGKNWITPE